MPQLNTNLTAIGTVKTLLATATTSGTTITNSDSISNYKSILIEIKTTVGSTSVITRREIHVCAITIGEIEDLVSYYNATTNIDVQITFVSTTSTKFVWAVANITIVSIKIYGIN